ncbi:hypothetical protein [Nitrospira sp. Nam80]
MRLAWRLRRGESFALFLIALFVWHGRAMQDLFVSASPEPAVDVRPVVVAEESALPTVLPQDSRLLLRSEPVEAFLADLEETIPDWTVVYGRGHHDPEFDDRLFQLNRSRDERRRDKVALGQRVTFLWTGRLSQFDPDRHGFPVAVGPEFVRTRWGVVRFKPADLPTLTAGAAASLQERLISRIENGEAINIKVAMTGHLIAEESVIYDFSHEDEGQGLIMPVVQVEQVDYVLMEP